MRGVFEMFESAAYMLIIIMILALTLTFYDSIAYFILYVSRVNVICHLDATRATFKSYKIIFHVEQMHDVLVCDM